MNRWTSQGERLKLAKAATPRKLNRYTDGSSAENWGTPIQRQGSGDKDSKPPQAHKACSATRCQRQDYEAPVKFTLFRNAHDNQGQELERPWPAVAPILTTHRTGEKDGWAVAFATFAGTRGNQALATRSAIALDVESSKQTGEIPPSEEVAARRLGMLGVCAVLWTTYNHQPDEPRYRIVVPIPEVVLSDDTSLLLDDWLAPALAQRLGLSGVVDGSKYGASSLFFLP